MIRSISTLTKLFKESILCRCGCSSLFHNNIALTYRSNSANVIVGCELCACNKFQKANNLQYIELVNKVKTDSHKLLKD